MLKFETEAEFEEFMVWADQQRESESLPADPLATFGIISRRFPHVEFRISEAMNAKASGLKGDALTYKMIQWLEAHHGYH